MNFAGLIAADGLAVPHHVDVGEDHPLLLVDLHARADVGERVVLDLGRLARLQAGLLVDAPRAAGEAEEHQRDADVDDVAAVAAARLGDEVEERRERSLSSACVCCRRAHAARELLHDDGEVEARTSAIVTNG